MSMFFSDADVAYESQNLVVLDISSRLPQHKTKKYRSRDLKVIDRVIYHQTAGSIKDMPNGVINTGKFFVRAKPLGRGWPGFAYNFYVPYDPDLYMEDYPAETARYVVYQTQRLDVVSYHTKTQNDTGVGVVFQGYFDNKRRPSAAQRKIAPLLWEEFLKPQLSLDDSKLFCHSHFSKPMCPGPHLDDYVRRVRGEGINNDTYWQLALSQLGYDLGKYGVDGKWGSISNEALKQFKFDETIPIGPGDQRDDRTRAALYRAFSEATKG